MKEPKLHLHPDNVMLRKPGRIIVYEGEGDWRHSFHGNLRLNHSIFSINGDGYSGRCIFTQRAKYLLSIRWEVPSAELIRICNLDLAGPKVDGIGRFVLGEGPVGTLTHLASVYQVKAPVIDFAEEMREHAPDRPPGGRYMRDPTPDELNWLGALMLEGMTLEQVFETAVEFLQVTADTVHFDSEPITLMPCLPWPTPERAA